MLQPVVGAMRKELLAGSYIQADETPVDVQTHDKRGQIIRRTYGSTGHRAGRRSFDFAHERGPRRPGAVSGSVRGNSANDDYIAYERGIGGPKMVHAACWAHPAQRFVWMP